MTEQEKTRGYQNIVEHDAHTRLVWIAIILATVTTFIVVFGVQI